MSIHKEWSRNTPVSLPSLRLWAHTARRVAGASVRLIAFSLPSKDRYIGLSTNVNTGRVHSSCFTRNPFAGPEVIEDGADHVTLDPDAGGVYLHAETLDGDPCEETLSACQANYVGMDLPVPETLLQPLNSDPIAWLEALPGRASRHWLVMPDSTQVIRQLLDGGFTCSAVYTGAPVPAEPIQPTAEHVPQTASPDAGVPSLDADQRTAGSGSGAQTPSGGKPSGPARKIAGRSGRRGSVTSAASTDTSGSGSAPERRNDDA